MDSSAAQEKRPVLTEESPFHFSCNDSLPCFTQCCRDVNIYLTPYDVLRLRRALRIDRRSSWRATRGIFWIGRPVSRSCNWRWRPTPCNAGCSPLMAAASTTTAPGPAACIPSILPARQAPIGLSRGATAASGCGSGRGGPLLNGWQPGNRSVYSHGRSVSRGHAAELCAGNRPWGGAGESAVPRFRPRPLCRTPSRCPLSTFYDVDEALFAQVQSDDEALLRLAFHYIRAQMDELYSLTRNKAVWKGWLYSHTSPLTAEECCDCCQNRS